jgi:hypothetical protein
MNTLLRLGSSLLVVALVVPACVSSAEDPAGGAGGGGKADDATSPLRGAWGHFVYDAGRIVQSGTLLFTYDQDQQHLRLRLGGFDHTAGTEGYLVHEPFALTDGFAEVEFAPDCTLYFAHEGRAIEVMQAGPCVGAVPPTMTLDGTYSIDRGAARIDTYRHQAGMQTGAMTTVVSGNRLEFAIGVSSFSARVPLRAAITGVIDRVPPGGPAVFDGGPDCQLTFTYTGADTNTDQLRIDQVGRCAAATGDSGLRFTGSWDVVE